MKKIISLIFIISLFIIACQIDDDEEECRELEQDYAICMAFGGDCSALRAVAIKKCPDICNGGNIFFCM